TLAVIGAQTRQSATPPGQMDAGEVVLGTSATFDQETAFQGNCTANPCRWGDYSGASPDPTTAGVVWGSNQLIGAGFFGFAQWTTQNFAVSTGQVAAPDFSLSVMPASQTVAAGSSTSYTVTVTPTGGFSGQVSLSVSGLPSGASGTFSPNPATTSSTLTVSIMSGTPAGTYTLTLTGTSGSLSHSTTVTLVVNSDFSLSSSPTSRTISHGQSTTYTVTIAALNSFTGSVTFSVSGLPSGAIGTFSPNPAASSSMLTVNTSGGTPRGTYTLTVSGTGGGKTHAVTVTLVVN